MIVALKKNAVSLGSALKQDGLVEMRQRTFLERESFIENGGMWLSSLSRYKIQIIADTSGFVRGYCDTVCRAEREL